MCKKDLIAHDLQMEDMIHSLSLDDLYELFKDKLEGIMILDIKSKIHLNLNPWSFIIHSIYKSRGYSLI